VASRDVRIIAAYAVLTAAVTYPLILHLTSAIPFGGGDASQNVWDLWWIKRALLDLHTSPYWTPEVHFPYGADLHFHTLNFLPSALAAPITATVGLAAAYNTIVLAGFVLSGYGMYCLARHALANNPTLAALDDGVRSATMAPFVAGVIFMCSSYRFAHLVGHLDLVSTATLPFCAWSLLKTRDEPGAANPIAAGLLLAATFLTTVYYFVFLLIFAALIALQTLWTFTNRTWKSLGRLVSAIAVAGIIASPVLLPMIVLGRVEGRTPNPAYDINRFSADLAAFVLPSPLHPALGHLTTNVFRTLSSRDGGIEGIVFLGCTALALAIVGASGSRQLRSPWLPIGVVFVLLALGPSVHVYGHRVPWPSALLPYTWLSRLPYGDIPRVPARFGVMAMMPVAVLAAAGLLRLTRGGRGSIVAASIATGLIVLENAVVPLPLGSLRVPDYYDRLRVASFSGGLLEIPIPDDPVVYPQRMLYQTVHQHPVFGGYLSRGLPPLAFDAIPGFSQLKTLSPDLNDIVTYDTSQLTAMGRVILHAYDVGSIVIDKRLLSDEELERARRIAGELTESATPDYDDGDVLAFHPSSRTELAAPFLWLDTGWSYLEHLAGQDAEGKPIRWRWMGDRARLGIFAPEATSLTLKFIAQAFGGDRDVRLSVNSKTVATMKIEWRDEAPYDTPPIAVPPGVSFLELTSVQPARSPNDEDRRQLSVAFFRVELEGSK